MFFGTAYVVKEIVVSRLVRWFWGWHWTHLGDHRGGHFILFLYFN